MNISKEEFLTLKKSIHPKSNNILSIIQCAINLSLFTLAILLYLNNSWWSYLAFIFILSIQMIHSYLILHECTHNSFFKSKVVNIITGHIASIFSIIPYYSRKYEHLMHHRSTLSFKEPSTQRALNKFQLTNSKTISILSLCWKFWIPVFAINEHIMIWKMIFVNKESSKTQLRQCRISAIFLLSIYSIIIAIKPSLLLPLIPALYLYFFWIEFFNLPHHIDAEIHDIPIPVPVWEQSKGTKSCAPTYIISKWLLLNFNYHSAHHLFPSIPWHQLDAVNQLLIKLNSDFSNGKTEIKENIELHSKDFCDVFKKYIKYSHN